MVWKLVKDFEVHFTDRHLWRFDSYESTWTLTQKCPPDDSLLMINLSVFNLEWFHTFLGEQERFQQHNESCLEPRTCELQDDLMSLSWEQDKPISPQSKQRLCRNFCLNLNQGAGLAMSPGCDVLWLRTTHVQDSCNLAKRELCGKLAN